MIFAGRTINLKVLLAVALAPAAIFVGLSKDVRPPPNGDQQIHFKGSPCKNQVTGYIFLFISYGFCRKTFFVLHLIQFLESTLHLFQTKHPLDLLMNPVHIQQNKTVEGRIIQQKYRVGQHQQHYRGKGSQKTDGLQRNSQEVD